MLRSFLFALLLLLAEAVRFYDFVPKGESHFNGVPVEKYARSMNRLIQLTHQLMDVDTSNFPQFEDMEWNPNATSRGTNPFLYQGDVALSEIQLDALVKDFEDQLAEKEGRPVSEQLYSVSTNLWRRFPINWSIDWRWPPEGGVAAIRRGIALWEESTCVTFRQSTNFRYGGIEFYYGNGCFSPYGKIDKNRISIGAHCQEASVIAHEIGHSLGLFHTQVRPDAQDYVQVFWNNIQPDQRFNFRSPPAYFRPATRDIPYDLGSAMHYGRYFFQTRRGLNTILPLDKRYYQSMGQRAGLSFTDAKEINTMYCENVCPRKLACLHGGYTDPKDCSKCRCPDGLGGKLCESVASSSGRCGDAELRATNGYQTLKMNGVGECNYRITAPQGRKVALVLDWSYFDGGNFQDACDFNYVELKYTSNLQSVGARFCHDYRTPSVIIPADESSNQVYIIYRSEKSAYGFTLRYRYEPTYPPAPVSSTTKRPETTTTARVPSGTTRSSSTFEGWGPWSVCSSPCGGCGTRIRRNLSDPHKSQHTYCNFDPCHHPSYSSPYCCGSFHYSSFHGVCIHNSKN
ncbi:hypothetical protein QR680_013583 [Steinernema hermaphroditum]|uniref:Zinc metalloproteinase n=1 Tax=Steinernema hermaphroditum TaxID=289476 RepID=A0AA39I845_9BILA|nr:hypothetical protein QR680_013583 [Steinernema hermaphroditum]